ncbi:MAG: hypothetical protein MUO19_00780, partial [Dehalococcoidales bacterium]|nr:hypothetical protein [Dehalococcoidales bacterium]
MATKKAVKKVQKAARNAKPDKAAKKKPARNPRSSGSSGGFLRLMFSTPVRQILIIVIVVVLLAVFWDKVDAFFGNLWDTLGLGLVFISGAIVTLITLAFRRCLGSLWFKWNRWLGAVAFILAAWGILSVFGYKSTLFPNGLGGSFGQDIINYRNAVPEHILRIIVLI